MNSLSPTITIITVNWYSTAHLTRLFLNLCDKAARPERLHFLIVDNTRGNDTDLALGIEQLESLLSSVEIIPATGPELKGSHAHAQALDQALPRVETSHMLILDPDVHVFAEEWDSQLMDVSKDVFAVGAPYPFWKLGKYHHFPSPVFLFADTEQLRNLNQSWTPFATNSAVRAWHFLCRQIVRLGFLANRDRVSRNGLIAGICAKLEQFLGVCGPDTGWLLARAAGRKKMKIELFTALTSEDKVETLPSESQLKPLGELTHQFECFNFRDRLFMTHKYGTGSRIWRTPRGHDTAYWLDLIQQIESGS